MNSIWPTIKVKIADLYLDTENIRLDLAGLNASQDALILDLFMNQDALEIAMSIAKNGLFQHEVPIVVNEKGNYVVLEGNRRVSALKALGNPSLVPSHATKLDHLAKASTTLPITEIEVKLAPNRKDAQPLLAAIHTADSRRAWATLRQAYFYFAQSKGKNSSIDKLIKQYPEIDIVKFVKMWEVHSLAKKLAYDTADQAEKVSNQQSFPITNLERLYNSEPFQTHMGMSFEANGKVKLTSNIDDFKISFKHVLLDIINGVITSRNINKVSDIESYLKNVPRPKQGTGKPATVASVKKSKRTSSSNTYKFLAPKDMKSNLPFPAISRMLIELQLLDYNKLPNAGHDLLRTFLECSLKAYFEHIGTPVPAKKSYTFLSDALAFAETHFDNLSKSDQTVRKHLQSIRVVRQSAGNTTNNYLFSDDFLNAINHNHTVFSTGPQVKAAWDQLEPLLRYLITSSKQKP